MYCASRGDSRPPKRSHLPDRDGALGDSHGGTTSHDPAESKDAIGGRYERLRLKRIMHARLGACSFPFPLRWHRNPLGGDPVLLP